MKKRRKQIMMQLMQYEIFIKNGLQRKYSFIYHKIIFNKFKFVQIN